MSLPLEIAAVRKCYGALCAVDEVSLSIAPGEVYGLLGPNGAGKTSIISMITTLERVDGGELRVFGKNVSREPLAAKKRLGCVPQELVHHGFFSVEELLHIYSGYYGIRKNNARIEYLLDKLALRPHKGKRVKELSGGMKRRLMIAKALLHSPKLLLLDEPTAGVDVELRAQLWGFIQQLREEGVAILLTTHYLEEAEALCDRVGILNKGKLLLEGVPKELVESYTMREVILTLKEPVESYTHPYLTQQSGHTLTFRFPSGCTIGALLQQLPLGMDEIQDLYVREGKLEDAMQRILDV